MALLAAPRLGVPPRPPRAIAEPPPSRLELPPPAATPGPISAPVRTRNYAADTLNAYAPVTPEQASVLGPIPGAGEYASGSQPDPFAGFNFQTVAAQQPSSPGGPVDYQALLAGDPILGQTLAGYNAQGVQNMAQLTAAQQRALIQYGMVPAGQLPGVNGIDPTTQQLAEQNTTAGTSTVAALRRAYQQAQQGSDASLAARGILRSGAYGQHAAENLQGYTQAGYQSSQQLLDYLQGLYSGYLSQQQALQGQGVQATNDALARLIQQIQAGQIGAGAPPSSAPSAPSAPYQPPPPNPGGPPLYVPGMITQPGQAYAY